MIDLPPAVAHGEIPRQCVMVVVQSYQLPAELIGGLLAVEGGRVGMANVNGDGSVDLGPAQINSSWLRKTTVRGIDERALRDDACKNLWVAGWIMRRCLDKFQASFWHAVGCYHTGENPRREAQKSRQRLYAVKVHQAILRTRQSFLDWLNGGRA